MGVTQAPGPALTLLSPLTRLNTDHLCSGSQSSVNSGPSSFRLGRPPWRREQSCVTARGLCVQFEGASMQIPAWPPLLPCPLSGA